MIPNSQPLPDLPLNPDFGSGVFRRRIRLQGKPGKEGKPGKVIAELEDCNHGFRSTVHHDGHTVTAIEAETLRFPMTTCDGAVTPIQALVGTDITLSSKAISRQVNPKANCTHLYDLSLLAIQHCQRGESDRQFDITIPDEDERATNATVAIDGHIVLNWTLRNWQIINAGKLNGLSLHKGFSTWVNELLHGDEKDAALALQKSYFVSAARRYDMSQLAGRPATLRPEMIGVCYSYTPGIVEHAVRSENSDRDFTHTPEQLLSFQ